MERALAEYLGVDHHTLYQVSTAGALVEGVYQGAVSVGMVREHGDFGLGTFEDLDGEMVVLDGHVFRVSSSGDVHEVPDDATTPFAVVTRFGDPDARGRSTRSTTSPHSPPPSTRCATRPTCSSRCGSTATSTRCTCAPRAAPRRACRWRSPPSSRRSSSSPRVDGTMVGFWSPPYASGVEIAGYHLHFLSDDRSAGGHVLDCRGRDLRVRVQEESDVHLALPDTAAFRGADLTHDPTADLDRAEH